MQEIEQSTTHIPRYKPEMAVDLNGNVTWKAGLSDYNPDLFYRGKQVTNDEFNELFVKNFSQGNYLSDSLTMLFKEHLGTAIYRSFTTDFKLSPSYIKSFSTADWGDIHEDGYYYITIPASEHGFIIADTDDAVSRMNIDTEMYVLKENTGIFYEVMQVLIDTDNTVQIYTDDNTLAGFLVIRTNDKAYRLAQDLIEASAVRGLAPVALTSNYLDLVNRPDTDIQKNASDILDIINGTIQIGSAINSESAVDAENVTTRIGGRLISNIFVQGSNYVNNAKEAITAKDYDTTSGTILNKFTSIDTLIDSLDTSTAMLSTAITNIIDGNTIVRNATNAVEATKAYNDGNGANIASTYLTNTNFMIAPDYAGGWIFAEGSNNGNAYADKIIPQNGFLLFASYAGQLHAASDLSYYAKFKGGNVTLNGVYIAHHVNTGYNQSDSALIPVAAGQYFDIHVRYCHCYFIPLKK